MLKPSAALKTFLLSSVVICSATLAEAASRVALVIGNSNYSNVNKLPNPINDAKLIETSLKSVGFTTVTAVNAGRKDFVAATTEEKGLLSATIKCRGHHAPATPDCDAVVAHLASGWSSHAVSCVFASALRTEEC